MSYAKSNTVKGILKKLRLWLLQFIKIIIIF